MTSPAALPSAAQLHEIRMMAQKGLISPTHVRAILGIAAPVPPAVQAELSGITAEERAESQRIIDEWKKSHK
jgi:hypothetical protein